MATSDLSRTIQGLRRVLLDKDGAGLSDRQLMDHFIGHREEAAFSALVRRHGPLVWGVCCRVIGHHQDAEDAFQATFLVLARRAASIRQPEMLANWLYGVAHRTALKAKATAGKRRVREKQVSDMPEPETQQRDTWLDLEPLIDRELADLPDKYRIAIVLCDLQGKTGKEVALQLKIPEGTLSSRLRTARVMLAKRLSRHGLTLSGGTLAAVLSQNSASALAPTAVVSSTIKSALLLVAGRAAATGVISPKVAALTEGVMKIMLLTRLKNMALVFLLLGMIPLGGGLLHSHYAQAAQQGPILGDLLPPPTPPPVPPVPPEPAVGPARQKDFGDRAEPRLPLQATLELPVPSVVAILTYLNDNANRVGTLRFDDVAVDVSTGSESFGMRGRIIAEKPSNVRIKTTLFGKDAVDIGSNTEEFWFRSTQNREGQYRHSYKDLKEGRVGMMPLPIQPEWLMEALGLGSFGPANQYKIELDPDGKSLRLIQKLKLPQGLAVRKIVVLRRNAVRAPEPQVTAFFLLDDATGKEICSAHVLRTSMEKTTGAIIPHKLELRVPAHKLKMALKMDELSINTKVPNAAFVLGK